jgi:hypothetical protein
MDWNVNFDELDGAAIVRTSGVFNVADHGRMVADIVGREEWHPGHPILFDHRALDFAGAGYDQMLGARNNHLAHDSEIQNARSAILMKSSPDFGIGRQFQLLAEGRVGAELRIFADELSARDWVVAKG